MTILQTAEAGKTITLSLSLAVSLFLSHTPTLNLALSQEVSPVTVNDMKNLQTAEAGGRGLLKEYTHTDSVPSVL